MPVGQLVRLVAMLALGGLVAWLVGFVFGLALLSVTAVLVIRTVLVLLVLALLTRVWARRAGPGTRDLTALAGAVLSYALCPPSWGGTTLFAQGIVPRGLSSLLLDLVVWTAVVVLSARSVRTRQVEEPRTPYAGRA